MDSEYYQIEVEFEVAMTLHNFERGNLYLQSKFKSYKKGSKPLTLARSGFLDSKSSLTIQLKEVLGMLPMSGYVFNCEPTKTVTIKVFERFDNDDFGLESIELLVPNEALQFKTALIRVNTELSGIRYLMHHWFFTVACCLIFSATFAISLSAIVIILLLKRLYLLSWL